MDLKLTDKRAFVSGSTYGIGYAIAKTLAIEGASVIINGRNENDIAKAVEKLKTETGSSLVTGVKADFLKENEIKRLIADIEQLDILINNVGYFEPKPFADITRSEWLQMFSLNVLSGVSLSQAFFPKMLGNDWGRIIFISSESGLQIPTEMIHYGVSKTAQLAVANGLAQLVAGTGVTVNSVLPGPTYSEGVEKFIQDLAAERKSTIAQQQAAFFKETRPLSTLQRFAHVDEVASAVAFLCSPLAAATNGVAFRTDGGIIKSIH